MEVLREAPVLKKSRSAQGGCSGKPFRWAGHGNCWKKKFKVAVQGQIALFCNVYKQHGGLQYGICLTPLVFWRKWKARLLFAASIGNLFNFYSNLQKRIYCNKHIWVLNDIWLPFPLPLPKILPPHLKHQAKHGIFIISFSLEFFHLLSIIEI